MKIYKITEASKYLGISINSLKTLANNGKLNSFKTGGEHRRFREDDLDAYMGVKKEKQERLTVIYARCSTAKQKENLERQKDRLRKHAEEKGYKYLMIDEIASGINEKRKGIHKLMKMCFEGKVERILIEYKDRLARFGYEYLDAIFRNLEIIVEVVEIKEKKSADFTFIDLFAGIGGIRMGFESAGGECVFTSEWDEPAQKTYQANFNEIPYGDITKIEPEEIPSFDMLLAGFPCQPFSQAGLKKGFEDTRGTLFFDIARIVEHHKPSVVFLENVRNLASHDKGNTLKVIVKTLEDLGYKVFHRLYNAKNFGVPQNRVRIYIIAFKDEVNFEFPKEPNTPTKLGDILEKNVDPKYTISDKLWAGHQRRRKEHKEKGNGFGYSLFNEKSEYTSTISARYYKDGSEILIEQKGKNPRKLTPKEASRLQGFPEDFIIPVSDNQAYKQFGNSVAVPVIKVLAKQIIKTLNKLPVNSLNKYENK